MNPRMDERPCSPPVSAAGGIWLIRLGDMMFLPEAVRLNLLGGLSLLSFGPVVPWVEPEHLSLDKHLGGRAAVRPLPPAAGIACLQLRRVGRARDPTPRTQPLESLAWHRPETGLVSELFPSNVQKQNVPHRRVCHLQVA